MNKICVLCQAKIKEKDTYFKIELHSNKKLKGTDYAHKSCWHKRQGYENELKNLIGGVKTLMAKSGVIVQ